VLTPPKYPQSAGNCRAQYEAMIRAHQKEAIDALTKKQTRLKNKIKATPSTDSELIKQYEEQLSEVEIKILQA
jgi:hypothetical protein